MFIGREKELKALGKLYQSGKFEFAIMYGRRRVGKTKLLTEFCKDKNSIFIVGEEFDEKLALKNFTARISEYFKIDNLPAFPTWDEAFKFILNNRKEERLVIVLDEFQYICNTNRGFLSFLQNFIDHTLLKTNVFLIVCGSSISFMENEVLAYKSPLYGRRTAQFKINPFDFFDACRFFGKLPNEEYVKYYSVLGGTPQYLLLFDYAKNFKENIIENILNSSSYLYDEAINLIKQELREVTTYNKIIESIATGSSRLNEISTKIGEATDKTAKYIKVLTELRILEKEYPFNEKDSSKKTIYKLTDNYFKFYYKFIYNNKTLIEQEKTEYMYEKIESNLNNYLGYIFEDICRQYIIRLNIYDVLPFVAEKIGRWWGNNQIKQRQEEIDIVAANEDSAIFCECKYTNDKVGMDVYNLLRERSELLNYKNKYYYIFSKSGFTDELLELKDERVKMISLEEIILLRKEKLPYRE